MGTYFGAPWGVSLKISTTLICFVVGVPMAFQVSYGRWIGFVLAGILLTVLLCMVRGYTVTPHDLEIHRVGWRTRVPLAGLTDATLRPGVMRGSWRLWGNGGAFSIHGWFSNAALGRYRAFVTDTRRTVVLNWPGATVVVSPDDPERFLRTIAGRLR